MSPKTFRIAMFAGILAAGCAAPGGPSPMASPQEDGWADSFPLKSCTLSTTGKNRYWILVPGYQIVLAHKAEQVVITVLEDTERVDGIETRVVEEREFVNGKLKEVSRNFFTICKEHADVFYHGEDVDDYKDGKVSGHAGAWRAGVRGARAGLMMPGKVVLGYRHYQEVAPGVAMDRAEIVTDAVTLECPAGEFKNCLKVVETTPLERGKSIKLYAPEVGMVADEDLVLVDRGHGRKSPDGPVEVPGDTAGAFSEAEIPATEMPPAVAALLKKLHPEGRIHEVKRETHPGGKTVYAIEVFIGEKQWDVEATPDGTVIRNEPE